MQDCISTGGREPNMQYTRAVMVSGNRCCNAASSMHVRLLVST